MNQLLTELLTAPGTVLTALGRRLVLPVLGLFLPVCVLCQVLTVLPPELWHPIPQQALTSYKVAAYRDWQSASLFLESGDRYHITAVGEWQYSPIIKLHGPRGNPMATFDYSSRAFVPPSYPSQMDPGGALLGRVGETGTPFYVGDETWGAAAQPGLLYFRINDDLLGDNVGYLTLSIIIEHAATQTP